MRVRAEHGEMTDAAALAAVPPLEYVACHDERALHDREPAN